jgi:hypothetical protein
MTTNYLIAIGLFLVSSLFIGVREALWLGGLYLGFAYLVLGTLMISNRSVRERYYRLYMNDPEGDKLLSEKQKNFFDRYYFPPKAIMAGLGLILLYWINHQQVVAVIGSWLKKLVR